MKELSIELEIFILKTSQTVVLRVSTAPGALTGDGLMSVPSDTEPSLLNRDQVNLPLVPTNGSIPITSEVTV